MTLNLDRILDIDYLNVVLRDIEDKLDKVKARLVSNYSFEQIMGMSDDDLLNLFGKYSLSCIKIIRYRELSSNDISKYADILPKTSSKSLSKQEARKKGVINLINDLNDKINEFNNSVMVDVDKEQKNLGFIKCILGLLSFKDFISEDYAETIKKLIMDCELSSNDKFSVSRILSKYIMDKNYELMSKKVLDDKKSQGKTGDKDKKEKSVKGISSDKNSSSISSIDNLIEI